MGTASKHAEWAHSGWHSASKESLQQPPPLVAASPTLKQHYIKVDSHCCHNPHSPAYSGELQFLSTQPQLPTTPGTPLLLQFAATSAHCSAAAHVILPPQASGKSTPHLPRYCPLQDLAMQPQRPLLQIPWNPSSVLQVIPFGVLLNLQRPLVGLQPSCWQELTAQLQRWQPSLKAAAAAAIAIIAQRASRRASAV